MNKKIFSIFCMLLIFLFSITFISAGNVIVQDRELNATDTAINRTLDKFSMNSDQLKMKSIRVV